MFDREGNPVSAEEVLDIVELEEYYRQRPGRAPHNRAEGPSFMSGSFFGEGFSKPSPA